MRVLPPDPTRRTAVLIGLLVVSCLFLALQYLHRPARSELDAATARLDRLREGGRHAEVAAVVGQPELEARLREYRRQLEALEDLIPVASEIGVLLRAISDAEERTGVEVTEMRPETLDEGGDHYDRLGYELAVLGSYHAIGAFLAEIASLERIVTPEELTMTAAGMHATGEDGSASVVASFRIRTYVAQGMYSMGLAELPSNAGAPSP
ncbi:MAG: type 4a pilus biogenesis protein PilO [Gemmatimonadetes bacterium]|nr:type 4a pilus biogenesis protein PilO [Gemmatimonadota bacterium]MCY3943048.1 type 4a pilus biogenesis protein PilO [Gemmatimonadota bacterium]